MALATVFIILSPQLPFIIIITTKRQWKWKKHI